MCRKGKPYDKDKPPRFRCRKCGAEARKKKKLCKPKKARK